MTVDGLKIDIDWEYDPRKCKPCKGSGRFLDDMNVLRPCSACRGIGRIRE